MHELTVSQLLSRGTFGEVFLGHFHGRRVAVKRLAPERRQDEYERSAFLSEATLMATLQHERIIQFVGVAWDDPLDVHVVTEFMDGGDLRTLLQTFDSQGRPVGFDACKLQIARHVIEGLAYLHSLQPAVLHRDLKSRNVLLSADAQRAKLIDFGVSRLRADQNSSTMTTCVGTLRWMAPEVMVGGRYGESADVFSFGVVLSELDTHEIPYNLLPEGAVVVHVYEGTLQVRFHRESDAEIVRLARDCMAYEPAQRPSASEVAQRLDSIWRSSYGMVERETNALE
ncbi:hypothetical protein PINS_up017100 [Pythium insidiosum]|nr:hypothetical protein PINS_up017100 [Pythium insidiosum]